MRIWYLTLLLLIGSNIVAQEKAEIITLGRCYEGAGKVNAIAGEENTYSRIWELKDANLSRGWLPVIDANGTFVYNSSVIDMSSALGALPIPGISDLIKPLPHEQYRITVDINQLIYDGGVIKSAREIEKADLEANMKQTEADIYKLRSQINTYYFNIMLLERQKEIIQNYLSLFDKRISAIRSGISNGMLLPGDVDVITAEKIKLTQQLEENEIRKTALLKVLSQITGLDLGTSPVLILPAFPDELSMEVKRPELELFDLRKQQLDAGLDLISSKRMPKAFGFATLGFGNPPGNNFFKDEFAPYYILGAGVKWNIFDWNKAASEKQVVLLQQSILENRKTDLSDNLTRLLEIKRSEIKSIDALIATDTELVALRKRISTAAESQYNNGTITATELMNEMTSERFALINSELHKVSLVLAQVEYYNISGQNIE
jgi:outer membrane protein TolC